MSVVYEHIAEEQKSTEKFLKSYHDNCIRIMRGGDFPMAYA